MTRGVGSATCIGCSLPCVCEYVVVIPLTVGVHALSGCMGPGGGCCPHEAGECGPLGNVAGWIQYGSVNDAVGAA